jgi:poly-gamma-glutamate synthesis protein (capsule biosynthesis protein)
MTIQPNKEAIQFAFIGDLFLGGEYISFAEKSGINMLEPFRNVHHLTTDADILVVNLEGPIYTGPNKRPDVSSVLFNHPDAIKYLLNHRECVVNLANNHIMDYGEEGLLRTIAILDQNNIKYVGAGRNYEKANQELILYLKNKKIAFVAYTSDENHIGAIIANKNTAGCATYLDLDTAVGKIRSLKNRVDTVCVLLHWGHEYYQYPSPDQVNLAHALVDAGADFIIGHHPHVIQGIENYKRSLILYSTGNFFFPNYKSQSGRIQYQKPMTKEFIIIFSILCEDGSISYAYIGGLIDDRKHMLEIFKGNEQDAFEKKMIMLSNAISDIRYDTLWSDYKKKRDKELARESTHEAFYKLKKTPVIDLIKDLTFEDIKRNIVRIVRIVTKTK